MADIRIEQEGESTQLVISGELTIECAGALRDALFQLFENENHLVLDLKNVTGIDLSCLQLLCSAHRTSLRLKKVLQLKAGYPEALLQAVEESGYLSRNPVCSPADSVNCFWTEISREILCRT